MKRGTEAVEKITSVLVRLLLRPKVYYLEEEKQAESGPFLGTRISASASRGEGECCNIPGRGT